MIKGIFLLLVFPTLVFAQVQHEVEEKPVATRCHSSNASVMVVKGGNAVDARFKVNHVATGKENHFDIIIHTHSYRETLQASDDNVLFMVDGLGKIFDVLNWTSRYESGPGKVVSSITIRLTSEELKSVGYAGAVGLKIGDNSFSIPHMARHNMRKIITRIEALSGNTAGFYRTNRGVKVVRKSSSGGSLASHL